MIVIAIIAILAAIAIPAYHDYVARAQVAEGLSLATGPKVAVVEYYAENSSWPSSNSDAMIAQAQSIRGKYVSAVRIESQGVVSVAFARTLSSAKIKASTLSFSPRPASDVIAWECTGTMDAQYRPKACR